jgi:hypothetical protein
MNIRFKAWVLSSVIIHFFIGNLLLREQHSSIGPIFYYNLINECDV